MPAVVEVLPSSDDEDTTHVTQQQQSSDREAPSEVVPNLANSPTEEQNECEALKLAGNKLFQEGKLEEALAQYRKAIVIAPKKPVPPPPVRPSIPTATKKDSSTPGEAPPSASEKPEDEVDVKPTEPPADTSVVDYTLTSQVYCNAGYCLMKLGSLDEALGMFSEAIRHDPKYQKAYLRRADCHYDLEKWSSALADYDSYEKVGGVLDASARARKATSKTKTDEEMQKMLGELKNLGNRFLGNFGISTDNFKFDKDPKTGGYSMRFER